MINKIETDQIMQKNFIQLRKHTLHHIPQLRVRRNFFDKRFVAGCSMMQCNADCCRHGVMVDSSERERILAHADLIRKHMEPHQEKGDAHWFEEDEEKDPDFSSGMAVGTQSREYGCVFLDSGGRCVLQKAATEERMNKFALKPFFCVAYPVTIQDGELIIDDPEFTGRTECCSVVKGGSLTVLDVCSEELQFVLGEEGFEELRRAQKA